MNSPELTSKLREARAKRKAFTGSPLGSIARKMQAVVREYLKARSQGVSREDGVRGIEGVLRDLWPFKASKFAPTCAECEDVGYRLRTCSHDLRCGRTFCAKQHPAFEHEYVELCFCAAGERRRGRPMSDNPEDRLAAVGRRQKTKPRGWRQAAR